MHTAHEPAFRVEAVLVPSGEVQLAGDLIRAGEDAPLVLFAHGSGSSRTSPRNRQVARRLNEAGFSTLLLDLLTAQEEAIDQRTRQHRFDTELLARRMVHAAQWAATHGNLGPVPLGFFGASTGSAAALIAAARLGGRVQAVVSRGGRPDLAGGALTLVTAATLLIVGGHDHGVIELNQEALRHLHGPRELVLVPGATHLFEEPGALEQVAGLAVAWFERYLVRPGR
ncbi:dienelactone hydrolase family protein [Ramlibacter rhizophilus]|uniref:Alpha/beta hydrolase n=1 Tax=Ramlibacter rhizophilus TaxID=1781167 RepID=A0A4Z0C268_9BURK|nr:dienelactone hydrolase family protein [Ramlibacter rhizophilus]TFZ04325.1 alpha/beta hydrolase [Ramlibacter rhizophilus]